MDGNGWEQYQKLVLSDLSRLSSQVTTLQDQVTNLRVELRELKRDVYNRSGVWGAIGGLIPMVVFLVYQMLTIKK